MSSKEKPTSSPIEDPISAIWKLERQVAEQLRHGVRTSDGSTVAVSVGSSMFTYVRRIGNELIVKYVGGCVVVTASARLVEETKVQVHSVSVHNICSNVDI
jgi:hypothetical protein